MLILLAIIGFETFLLLCRWQMITGWFRLCGRRAQKNRDVNDFVSLDARRLSANKGNIELSTMGSPPESRHSFKSPLAMSPISPSNRMSPAKLVTPLTRIEDTDYYNDEVMEKETAEINAANKVNFSRPRGPSVRYSADESSVYSVRSKNDLTRHPTLPRIDDEMR